MNDLCIRMEGVSKRYPHFFLDSMSLELPEGNVLGFIGANGAGKSTTIRILMGLVRQDSGSVEVLGHPMPAESADVLGRMNFESPYVDMPMRLTVRQNLTVFGRLYAVEHLKDRIAQLASDLDDRLFSTIVLPIAIGIEIIWTHVAAANHFTFNGAVIG